MSNEERAQIIKERWASISDSLKCVYVALSRFEEATDRHEKIQAFY